MKVKIINFISFYNEIDWCSCKGRLRRIAIAQWGLVCTYKQPPKPCYWFQQSYCWVGILAYKACGVANQCLSSYFPNWLYQDYLPSKIDFKKYTHIYYAFALQVKGNVPVWEDPEIMSGQFVPTRYTLITITNTLAEDVEYGFPALVKAAKAAGTKVTISGNWYLECYNLVLI